MKFVVVFFILAVYSGVAVSRRVQPRNVLTDGLRNALEKNRDNLANLHVDKIDLGDLGSVEDVTISGLEKFQIAAITANRPLSLKVKNLTLVVDDLNIEGSYDLINVTIPKLVGNLNGQGNFSIGLRGVTIFAVLNFKAQGLTKIVLDEINDLQVNVDLAIVDLENIDGGQDTDDQLSAILPDLIKEAANQLLQNREQDLVDAINTLAGLN